MTCTRGCCCWERGQRGEASVRAGVLCRQVLVWRGCIRVVGVGSTAGTRVSLGHKSPPRTARPRRGDGVVDARCSGVAYAALARVLDCADTLYSLRSEGSCDTRARSRPAPSLATRFFSRTYWRRKINEMSTVGGVQHSPVPLVRLCW